MRKLHRVLGLVLLAPFLLWTATGLLFLLKPGWGPAYELLDPFETSTLNLAAVLTPTEALRLAGLKDNPERVELGQPPSGLCTASGFAVPPASSTLAADAWCRRSPKKKRERSRRTQRPGGSLRSHTVPCSARARSDLPSRCASRVARS